jgi:GNAT superfamily N-acetyltransferase
VKVRRATSADLPVLVPLFDSYRQFYEQASSPSLAERFLAQRLAREESIVFLAEESGAAVGFTLLYPSFSSVSLRRIFVLNDLFVPPAARHRGAGGLLLEAARDWGRNQGAHYLELSTAVDNPAQRLYEAHGWRPDLEFLHYELSLEDG